MTSTLSDKLYSQLARILAKPRVRDWLIAKVQDRPYFTIRSLDKGYIYMRRWWLVPKFALKEWTYVSPFDTYTVYEPKPWWPFRWRIHQILRADYERHYHNHPTGYRTFILDGWYIERAPNPHGRFASAQVMGEMEFGESRVFEAGMTAYRPQAHWHTIEKVQGETKLRFEESVTPVDGVWTLFCMSNKDRAPWGFLVEGKMVKSEEYFKLHTAKEKVE